MNPWGIVPLVIGASCIYIGARGTQGKVWQMITGNTALSTSSEASALTKQRITNPNKVGATA